VSKGSNPKWAIDIVILGDTHNLNFDVKQYELSQTFHEFFDRWLKSLFGTVSKENSLLETQN